MSSWDSKFEREQSEYNMAFSYLNRLNSLFYYCDESSMNLDVANWFQSLITLFRELSTEMKDDEIKTKTEEIKKIFNRVNENIISSNKKGRKEINPELYWEIHNFELFLRTVLKESGLQQKMKDDAMNALR